MRLLILLIACVALAGCPNDGDGGGYAVPDDSAPSDVEQDRAGDGPEAPAPSSSGDPPTTSVP